MGKRSLQQKASRAMGKVGASSTSLASGSGIKKNGSGTLHRGRRKRLEAKERAASKQTFIEEELAKLEAIAAKKRETVKKQRLAKSVGKALSVLPDLADALPDLDDKAAECGDTASGTKGRRALGSKHGLQHKAWSRTVDRESEQLERVQNHKAVKDMGIAALRAHLANTVCVKSKQEQAGGKADGIKNENGISGGGISKNKKMKKRKNGKNDGKCKKENSGVDAVAAERREHKGKLAKIAASMTAKRHGEVQKQTMKSLLSGKRGRIGEKREKLL